MDEVQRIQLQRGNWNEAGCDVIIMPSYPCYLKRYGLSLKIYEAAGEMLESECQEFLGGEPGSAELSRAYNLKQYGTSWLVHAVPNQRKMEEDEENNLMMALYRNSFQTCIEYSANYKRQTRRIAGRYYQGEKLNQYMSKVEHYIENHPIRTIGIVPLKIWPNNKEQGVRQSLEAIKEFLRWDTSIESIHILCENVEIYNEYVKWLNI